MSVYLKKTFLSATTLVIMLALLNIGASFNTFAAAETKKKYSGEEIFGGVFFGQGEVAKLFPEIWEQYQATIKDKNEEFAKVKNKVISELKTKDAEFFNRFGEEMQSGDHIRIQSALESGAKGLKAVNKAEFNKGTKQSSDDFSNQRDVTVHVDVAIAVVVVAIVFLVITVIDLTPVAPLETVAAGSLQRDELVDKIAVRLDAAS